MLKDSYPSQIAVLVFYLSTISSSSTSTVIEVFTDLSVWMGIRRVIEQVNANALAA